MSVQTKKEIVEEWITLHLDSKLSHTEIAKKYNVNRETVRRNLTKFGIQNINYHNLSKHNISKFNKIENENDAYWLGFIYADGYISDRNDFELSLQLRDAPHLEKFKIYLESNTKIIQDSYRCRFIYRNKHLTNNLKIMGVSPRKSLTLKFPINKIPLHLIRHFIRGYFDGDGSIGIYNNRVQISVLGTIDFLNGIKRNSPVFISKYVSNHKSEITFSIRLAHKKARIFLNWLYKDSTVFLDRKYEKYLIAVSNRNV